MSHLTAEGIVVRAAEYKETDSILSVYTETEGLLTVTARGARKKDSPHAAAAQIFYCARFTLSEYRERYTVKETESLLSFHTLRGDLAAAALACYLAALAVDAEPEGGAFRLLCAALNALCAGNRPKELVKAAFELRLLRGAGLDPMLDPALPRPEGDAALAARYVSEAPIGKVFSFTMDKTPLRQFSALCERYVLAQFDRPPPSLEYYHKVGGFYERPDG